MYFTTCLELVKDSPPQQLLHSTTLTSLPGLLPLSLLLNGP